MKKDSIRAIGLKNYLNRTASDHNNQDYDNFLFFVNLPKPPSVNSLAGIFGVSYPTMRKWLDVYDYETEKQGVR